MSRTSIRGDVDGRRGRVARFLAATMLVLAGVAGSGTATFVSAAEPVPGSPAASGGAVFQPGDVFAGIGAGKFNHFDSTGTLIGTLDDGQTVAGENATTGMCFDPAGDMFATNVRANSMSKFGSDGTLLAAKVGTFNAQPESCLIVDGTTIFTSEVAGTGDILKLDLSGSLLARYDVRRSDWIDLAADRCTMLYTDEGRAIHRFDVCTNTPLKDFASGGVGDFALRILPDGSVLVAATSAVRRYSPAGVEIASYSAVGENWFFALNLDPDGTHFWTGGLRTGTIYEFALTPPAPPVLKFSAQVASHGGTELAGIAVFGEITASQSSPSATAAAMPTPTASTVPAASEAAPPSWILALVVLLLVLLLLVILVRRRRGRPGAPPSRV